MMDYDLPVGAKPNNSPVLTINPREKYREFRRGVKLNERERHDLDDICRLGAEQIIYCYTYFFDREVSPPEFAKRCKGCPYCRKRGIYDEDDIHTNVFPYFIARRDEYEIDSPKYYVYLISDGEYIKIGIAKDVNNRLSDLQVANARKLDLVCSIPTKSYKDALKLETFLHNQYAMFKMNGEWFNILHYIQIPQWEDFFSTNKEEEEKGE